MQNATPQMKKLQSLKFIIKTKTQFYKQLMSSLFAIFLLLKIGFFQRYNCSIFLFSKTFGKILNLIII